MVSFSLIGSEARLVARFGRGRGSIFLDNVGCNGTEALVTDCTNRGIGVHRCSHFEDAGVVCSGIQYNVLKQLEDNAYYIYNCHCSTKVYRKTSLAVFIIVTL